MSRPHGAASVRAPDRIVKSAPTFTDARRNLADTLSNLSFVHVVSVTCSPTGVYTGEAVEMSFRDSRDKPKLVFFDKFGRTRGQLRVGPINVAQMPMGPDHPTSVPTVGDVLVGSLVPNTRKSHLDSVMRGWSSDAKPLWELLRVLRFGTRSSEFEARSMLLQPSALLVQSSQSLKQCRDDIYMTARVVLWGNVRPLQVLASIQDSRPLKEVPTAAELDHANGLRISSKATDFVDSLTIKFSESRISESFAEGFVEEYVPSAVAADVNPYKALAKPDVGPMAWIMANGGEFKGPAVRDSVAAVQDSVAAVQDSVAAVQDSAAPNYVHQQPPAYPKPSSPAYAPYSPPYTTESPQGHTPMYGAQVSPHGSPIAEAYL